MYILRIIYFPKQLLYEEFKGKNILINCLKSKNILTKHISKPESFNKHLKKKTFFFLKNAFSKFFYLSFLHLYGFNNEPTIAVEIKRIEPKLAKEHRIYYVKDPFRFITSGTTLQYDIHGNKCAIRDKSFRVECALVK